MTNPQQHNETLPIAAGGVLALVGLGGLAFAMKRRREDDAEERTSDEFLDPDTPSASMAADQDSESLARREDSPIIAPPLSAFKWNGTDQSRDEETLVARDDREKGESWVERAYRGPSPLNPSVSLKARLKRAAFFDKRERDAAAGLAQPVDPTAGLPDRMVEDEQNERNREFA